MQQQHAIPVVKQAERIDHALLGKVQGTSGHGSGAIDHEGDVDSGTLCGGFGSGCAYADDQVCFTLASRNGGSIPAWGNATDACLVMMAFLATRFPGNGMPGALSRSAKHD